MEWLDLSCDPLPLPHQVTLITEHELNCRCQGMVWAAQEGEEWSLAVQKENSRLLLRALIQRQRLSRDVLLAKNENGKPHLPMYPFIPVSLTHCKYGVGAVVRWAFGEFCDAVRNRRLQPEEEGIRERQQREILYRAMQHQGENAPETHKRHRGRRSGQEQQAIGSEDHEQKAAGGSGQDQLIPDQRLPEENDHWYDDVLEIGCSDFVTSCGIDVENRVLFEDRLIRRILHPSELEIYEAYAQSIDSWKLFPNLLWNRKESYLKCIGTGLLIDPREICVLGPEWFHSPQPRISQLLRIGKNDIMTSPGKWNFTTPEDVVIDGKACRFLDGVSSSCTASICCNL